MFQSWLHLSHVEGFFQGPSNIFLVYPIWHFSRHQCNQMSRIHQSQRLLKENDISCTSFLQLKKINKQMGDFFLRGFKKTMNNQWWMSLCVCVIFFQIPTRLILTVRIPKTWICLICWKVATHTTFLQRVTYKTHVLSKKVINMSSTKITNQPTG